MRVIGLTGGIAMGKSTAAQQLRTMGIPVHDSDAAVHRLYGAGGAGVTALAPHFPSAIMDKTVDRARLRDLVLAEPKALRLLETLIHPLVRGDQLTWLKRHRRRRARAVVLDIPLLFEGGRQRDVDGVWVVDCPARIQRARALARPGMTPQALSAILKRQWRQSERLKRADQVIPTGLGHGYMNAALRAVIGRT